MTTNLKDILQFPDLIQNKIDYWKYLTPNFENHLNQYLPVFEKSRAEKKIIPSPEAWELLPFGPFANDSSWKWRRQSLKIIKKHIGKKKIDCLLEIGSWNGWLTKTLSKQSETVIATDYFVSPFDGIGNIASLAKNIIPVQCNVGTIANDFKPSSFDVIVLNHNLSFTNNPVAFINGLIPLLKPKGAIISLGNTFYKDPKKKIEINRLFAEQFYNKYQTDLYIQPVKGYLDNDDKKSLLDLGFKIKMYNYKFLHNLYAQFNFKKPSYNYILYIK